MPEVSLPQWETPVAILGDKTILQRHKTAFFCSRSFPAKAVLPSFDWAKEMREEGECVISGFHSTIEKDVFEILLSGKQPLILALARTLHRRITTPLAKALEQKRLLIISPFSASANRPTVSTARKRNKFMLAVADEIVVAHAEKEGNLASLLAQAKKPIKYLV